MTSNHRAAKCRPLEQRISEQLIKMFPMWNGFLRVGEEDWLMLASYERFAKRFSDLRFREDDVCVCSMPRSGTTLMMELTWLVANDMNFKEARERPLIDRFSFLEFDTLVGEEYSGNMKGRFSRPIIDSFDELPSPRFINTHLPFSLIPNVRKSGCKIIYMLRNPKDMAVSWYNFCKSNKAINFQGDLSQFCDYFMQNLLPWTPYWKHAKAAWFERHSPNLLVLFYEDVIKDMPATIKRVSKFMDKSYSDEEIGQLARHMSFEEFQANPMVNVPFPKEIKPIEPRDYIRQGISGGWKNVLCPETVAKFDQWIAENSKGTDLMFLDC